MAVGLLALLCSVTTTNAQNVPEGFSITTVQDDLASGSVGFAFLPDERILVIHHQSGEVELIVNETLVEEPLLVVDSLVISSEQGLLGIALDPDYPDSNYVYLFHTKSDSVNQVSRFTMEGDLMSPDSEQLAIDPASKKKIYSAPDTTRFHNGGTLRFGQDKTLYISIGDDAYTNEVQSLSNHLGKIMRINRDGSIPEDNPVFPNAPEDALPEVFAMGLRNPFRFNIDPVTQQLVIGDVGTVLYEEINVAKGGDNFGYPHYEGPEFFRDSIALATPNPSPPAYGYPYASPRARSAIALAYYRPSDDPGATNFPAQYDGAAFFADFFDTRLQYLLNEEGSYTTYEFGTGVSRLVDASVARDGSLYMLSYQGTLYRIAYDGGSNVSRESEPPGAELTLRQNYPNPFRGTTTLPYSSNRADHIAIDVYDLLGRHVATVVDAWHPAGKHHTPFDASKLAPGHYLVRMRAGDITKSRLISVLGQ